MKYKYYFKVIQCNRAYSNFMRGCDLGIDDIGVSGIVSFITDKEPKENKEKLTAILMKAKENKDLQTYFAKVDFDRVEIVED